MENPIANLKLVAIDKASGRSSEIKISMDAPLEEPDGTWGCRIDLSGSMRKIYGGDSMQALCLTMNAVKLQLERLEKSHRLLYPCDDPENEMEFSSELYFETTSHSHGSN